MDGMTQNKYIHLYDKALQDRGEINGKKSAMLSTWSTRA
jgi:hypothetical protein